MRKFIKVLTAFVLALSLTSLTACDVFANFFGKPTTPNNPPSGSTEGGDQNTPGDSEDNGDDDKNEGGDTQKPDEPTTPVTPVKYTVAFVTNGGVLSGGFESYTAGEEKSLPETVTKAHYTFGGWFTDKNLGGSKITKISKTDTGNKTFYAKWVAETYEVTLYVDGAKYMGSDAVSSYTYDVEKALPVLTKNNYTFNGWYDNSSCTGSKITKIVKGETGKKSYYAKFVANQTAKKSKVTLVVNGGTLKSQLTEYVEGAGAVLPLAMRTGYAFGGWYLNSDCTGTKITQITASDKGDKIFYAKWTAISADTLKLVSYGGYDEGAYVEFGALNGVDEDEYQINYKKKSDSSYVALDSELIRINDGLVRADIVGISAGDYTVQVIAGTKSVTQDLNVTAYDRSGYAHFNLSSSSYKEGIGGYKTDGTPKDNAQIIYVTEENKNTIVAPWNSEIVGIVNILGNVSNAKVNKKAVPVIVRVIGKISAATWNEKDYSAYTDSKGQVTADIIANNTRDKDNNKLSKAEHLQASLISAGYNTLNEYAGCTELIGLSSKIKYDSSKKEFDSCWNDCVVSGAKNLTVEGIGTDAELFQWGMTFKKSYSIEVRNLTFDDYTEDACSFEGSTSDPSSSQRIWLHHNTFNEGVNYWDVCNEQDKHDGDGSTDFKGVSYVTIAYNHYIKTHKTGLIGGGDTHLQSNITFHHNHYEGCKSRLPLARQANMHMYNNYYNGTTDTCLSIRAAGYAFIENCYFENAKNPLTTIDSSIKETVNGETVTNIYKGVIKAYGCIFTNKSYQPDTSKNNVTIVTDRTAKVANQNKFGQNFDTDPSKFYYDSTNKRSNVTLLTSAEQAKTDCLAMAGVRKN